MHLKLLGVLTQTVSFLEKLSVLRANSWVRAVATVEATEAIASVEICAPWNFSRPKYCQTVFLTSLEGSLITSKTDSCLFDRYAQGIPSPSKTTLFTFRPYTVQHGHITACVFGFKLWIHFCVVLTGYRLMSANICWCLQLINKSVVILLLVTTMSSGPPLKKLRQTQLCFYPTPSPGSNEGDEQVAGELNKHC